MRWSAPPECPHTGPTLERGPGFTRWLLLGHTIPLVAKETELQSPWVFCLWQGSVRNDPEDCRPSPYPSLRTLIATLVPSSRQPAKEVGHFLRRASGPGQDLHRSLGSAALPLLSCWADSFYLPESFVILVNRRTKTTTPCSRLTWYLKLSFQWESLPSLSFSSSDYPLCMSWCPTVKHTTESFSCAYPETWRDSVSWAAFGALVLSYPSPSSLGNAFAALPSESTLAPPCPLPYLARYHKRSLC